MNSKQRNKNRVAASMLTDSIGPPCPECGMRERHWIDHPISLLDIIEGRESQGFWVCPKFYGADGRRLET